MIKRKKRNVYPLFWVIAVIIVLIFFISISFYKMHPVIMNVAVSNAETIMLNSANNAVLLILEDEEIYYNDIVKLSDNNNGYIKGLEIDTYKINRLKSLISNKTSDLVAESEHYNFGIPLGSFFNNNFTNGFGPLIPFKMQMTTTAFVDFSNQFKSAGINQVLHIINVDILIKANLVVAGYRKSFETKTSVIAAQTVIVGETPDAFTNVVESEKDNTGGLINDYGAIAE